MSCVFTGLVSALKLNIPAHQFLEYVKAKNTKTIHVTCDGVVPTEQQYNENMGRIRELTTVNDGYDMSAFDPLLFLVCELYKTSIIHTYNGIDHIYLYEGHNRNGAIRVFSNTMHFWC